MSNKMYDILKWVAGVVIPALAYLYSGLASTWGLPYADKVPETLMLVDAFMGAILGISSIQYKKTQTNAD